MKETSIKLSDSYTKGLSILSHDKPNIADLLICLKDKLLSNYTWNLVSYKAKNAKNGDVSITFSTRNKVEKAPLIRINNRANDIKIEIPVKNETDAKRLQLRIPSGLLKLHNVGSRERNAPFIALIGYITNKRDIDSLIKLDDPEYFIKENNTNEPDQNNRKTDKPKLKKSNYLLPEQQKEIILRERLLGDHFDIWLRKQKTVSYIMREDAKEYQTSQSGVGTDSLDFSFYYNNEKYIAELKSTLEGARTVKQCIRLAIGQLLDYALYDRKNNEYEKLLIVVDGKPTKQDFTFIETINSQLKTNFQIFFMILETKKFYKSHKKLASL